MRDLPLPLTMADEEVSKAEAGRKEEEGMWEGLKPKPPSSFESSVSRRRKVCIPSEVRMKAGCSSKGRVVGTSSGSSSSGEAEMRPSCGVRKGE
jgi:hypothetical protein